MFRTFHILSTPGFEDDCVYYIYTSWWSVVILYFTFNNFLWHSFSTNTSTSIWAKKDDGALVDAANDMLQIGRSIRKTFGQSMATVRVSKMKVNLCMLIVYTCWYFVCGGSTPKWPWHFACWSQQKSPLHLPATQNHLRERLQTAAEYVDWRFLTFKHLMTSKSRWRGYIVTMCH